MVKLSQKAKPSPSASRPPTSIDLGKNNIDLGQKSRPQPSITSGGIGVTQEVTNIGGVGVSVGGNIDITPIDFGIIVNPDQNTISVATGAEIPGGLLGVSGGVQIDLNTGEVIGGSIGGEALGLGINVSNSREGGLGIEFTIQIPGTPIELSLGLGFPPEPKTPISPPPIPQPPIPPPPGSNNSWERPILPQGNPGVSCIIIYLQQIKWQVINSVKPEESFNYTVTNDGSYDGSTRFYQVTNTVFDQRGSRAPIITTTSKQGIADRWRQGNILEIYQGGGVSGVIGAENEIYKYLERAYHTYTLSNAEAVETYTRTYSIIYSNCNVRAITTPPPPPPISSSPFPNPPPRKINKMDECCRLNLAFSRAIYNKLGLARFPGQLPATIIQEVAKEGEIPPEPAQVPIPDLVSLIDWIFKRDDERWGQWVVQIDVKDADITTEGDQKKQIKFPNLAESIAEIEGQILSITANVEALVAITTKNLVESGLSRQEAIKGYLASKAIIKYMAFPTTEIDVSIPVCFTPEAESIDRLIQESTIHIKGIDYTQKETLRDIYLDLLQAAAIIRAVHWERIDTKQDTKVQLLNRLRGIASFAASVKNPTPDGETQSKPTQDFEDFLDTVEDGFRNVSGLSDPENPYGKTPDRRPLIRQIGENISQAGGK
jgi:hypothetical protein